MLSYITNHLDVSFFLRTITLKIEKTIGTLLMLYVCQIRLQQPVKCYADFISRFVQRVNHSIAQLGKTTSFNPVSDSVMIVSHEYLYGSDFDRIGLAPEEKDDFEHTLQALVDSVHDKKKTNLVIFPGTVVLIDDANIINRAYFFVPHVPVRFVDKSDDSYRGGKIFDWHGCKVLVTICCRWNELCYDSVDFEADIHFIPAYGRPLLTGEYDKPHQLYSPKVGSIYICSDGRFKTFEVFEIKRSGVVTLSFDSVSLNKCSGVAVSDRVAGNSVETIVDSDYAPEKFEQLVNKIPVDTAGVRIKAVTSPLIPVLPSDNKKSIISDMLDCCCSLFSVASDVSERARLLDDGAIVSAAPAGLSG